MSKQGDAKFARELHALAKKMVEQTESPVVLDVGITALGLAKVLLIETAPDEFEHVRAERVRIA